MNNDQPNTQPEILQKPQIDDPVYQYMRREIDLQRTEEERRRAEPKLRLAAIRLVEAFSDLFTDAAAELAQSREDNTPWGEDDAREDLLWAFQEFITTGLWDEESYPYLLKHYQITRRHAADWYNVDLDANGEPIEPKDE